MKYPAVTLPVVDMALEPNAAISVVTLALLYVAGRPVSCEPLPKINPPEMLPVVDTVFDPKLAMNVATLALP